MGRAPELPTIGIGFDELPLVRDAKNSRKKAVKHLEKIDRKRRELISYGNRLDRTVINLIRVSKAHNPENLTFLPDRDHMYEYKFKLPEDSQPFQVTVTATILEQGTKPLDPDHSDAWRYSITRPYTLGHGAPAQVFTKDGNNNYLVSQPGNEVTGSKLPKPKMVINYANLINGLTQGIQNGAVTVTSRN
ncbi:MAG: hypothetical protein AAB532_04030 [Patescibacteria group bacterium]